MGAGVKKGDGSVRGGGESSVGRSGVGWAALRRWGSS